jgi:hypothetical protein
MFKNFPAIFAGKVRNNLATVMADTLSRDSKTGPARVSGKNKIKGQDKRSRP